MFYTYAYLREDKTPYYIGKGSGSRVFVPHKGRNNNIVIGVPSEDRILILKENLTEEEAFKHEKYMISIFGRKNNGTGILRNLTDGGEGSSGHQKSDEWKRIQSERMKKNNPMYNPESIEKMRKKQTGKKQSDETIQKRVSKTKGRRQSDDERKKRSEVRKGIKFSDSHIENLKKAQQRRWSKNQKSDKL
jgi:hypothetical protein